MHVTTSQEAGQLCDSIPSSVVLLCGLQASGKTSFYHQVLRGRYLHVSMDHYTISRRRKQALAALETALEGGSEVCVDNTHPTIEERAEVIRRAQAHGQQVVAFFFESKVDLCRDRNQKRDDSSQVPLVAIYSTIKKLVPPTLNEGFVQVFSVRLLEAGFEVMKEDRIESERP